MAFTPSLMKAELLARCLVDALPASIDGLYNPWTSSCSFDARENPHFFRRDRLARHLNCDPVLILAGEAPSYQGCRYTGIAFTSERMVCEGSIPRIDAPGRITNRALPFSEPSGTIVWGILKELGVAERTILWNAVQLHPHRPGEIHTNRTPTVSEVALGRRGLAMLTEAFPQARLVAIGRKAHGLMSDMGIVPATSVRHPARGGATLFRQGLRDFVQTGLKQP